MKKDVFEVKEIRFIETEEEEFNLKQQYSRLPDHCPMCRKSLIPEYVLQYYKSDYEQEVICICPNNDCGSLFIATFMAGNFVNLKPYTKEDREFTEEISTLSPDFIEIYNQAHHAEQEGLSMICGVGYRKSLEYLIKDFAISENPNENDKIQSMPFMQCVNQYIKHEDIRDMTIRAVWLGNDETHYFRKWQDKDLQDLKSLIDLVVYHIVAFFKTEKYKTEMKY